MAKQAPAQPALPAMPPGMNTMVAVKLWQNPCRLSFRTNFIAHHFNQPVYDWIERSYGLTMPEHVVLYALGLREGITADDVAASSSRPKNTLSRAINSLLSKKLISRMFDEADRRRRLLYLTAPGRKVLQETVPMLVAREDMLFGNLNAQERETLNYLLTKVILNQAEWPTQVNKP